MVYTRVLLQKLRIIVNTEPLYSKNRKLCIIGSCTIRLVLTTVLLPRRIDVGNDVKNYQGPTTPGSQENAIRNT
jgi:hypothetical protein